MRLFIFFIIQTFSSIFVNGFGFGMLGPADVAFKSVEECEEKAEGLGFSISAKKLDRKTYGFNVILDSTYDLDGNVGLKMQGSRWADGGWKPGAFDVDDDNACKALKTLLGDVFKALMKEANVEDCPIPAGSYKVENFVFDNTQFKVPQLYGDYKMKMEAVKDGVPQVCFLFYYEMVPKKD